MSSFNFHKQFEVVKLRALFGHLCSLNLVLLKKICVLAQLLCSNTFYGGPPSLLAVAFRHEVPKSQHTSLCIQNINKTSEALVCICLTTTQPNELILTNLQTRVESRLPDVFLRTSHSILLLAIFNYIHFHTINYTIHSYLFLSILTGR